jgi:hypothetical protein
MTDTAPTKRPARTPAQRQRDLRARAATLIAEGTETDLQAAADSLLIEALGTAYRRGQSYALADIAGELLRRLSHPGPLAPVARPEPEPEPDPKPEPGTVTRGYPTEVKSMAVELLDAGASSRDIRAAILKACGKAPDRRNVARLVRSWRATPGN